MRYILTEYGNYSGTREIEITEELVEKLNDAFDLLYRANNRTINPLTLKDIEDILIDDDADRYEEELVEIIGKQTYTGMLGDWVREQVHDWMCEQPLEDLLYDSYDIIYDYVK